MRVKAVRMLLQMTQADFARVIGSSQKSVQKIEAGEAFPDEVTIGALCERGQVTADFIYLGREDGLLPHAKAALSQLIERLTADERGTSPRIRSTE